MNAEAEEKEHEEQSGGGKSKRDICLDAMLGMGEEIKERKEKKEKHQYPKELIILDDLGANMRNPAVGNLLIKNRHYKSMVLLSGQHFYHLSPESRENINIWLVFKNQPEAQMMELYKAAGVTVPFEEFMKMFKECLKYKNSFFYINATDNDFRCTFSHRFTNKNM